MFGGKEQNFFLMKKKLVAKVYTPTQKNKNPLLKDLCIKGVWLLLFFVPNLAWHGNFYKKENIKMMFIFS